MNRIRATMSILMLAAVSSLMTNAMAHGNNTCNPYNKPEASPFVIGFEADKDGTTLTPVVYLVKDGKLGTKLTADTASKGALSVNGQRCGAHAIAVIRFWNHNLFYTIEIAPGVYFKIPIAH